MGNARFLDKVEECEKLGLIPGIVQQWEDGRRSVVGRPGGEVWYFDAVMEDGTKFVGGFRTKPQMGSESTEDAPLMVITVTTPDGKVYSDTKTYDPKESSISTEKCDFKCGPHSVVGDLENYYLTILPIKHTDGSSESIDGLERTSVNGVGAQLHFEALVKPFRHGAGRTVFDDNDELFSSWFCIPKMRVSGKITVGEKTYEVNGMGYHDHRCMAINDVAAWHHWLWGRQAFENYTVVIYDLVTSEKFGFVRIPLFAVYDKEGSIIFENNGTYSCEIMESSYEEKSRKDYPKKIKYIFEDDGKRVEYTLNWREILEVRELYWSSSEEMRAIYDSFGIQISYNRYFSDGEIIIFDEDSVKQDKGTMIYEFAYVGKPDSRAHL